MALAQERTLEDLRTELASRLGQGAMGAGINVTLLNSVLSEAQEWLYQNLTWRLLEITWDRTLGAAQILLDYPDDCEPDRIERITALVNSRYLPLREGIDWHHESDWFTHKTHPQRYRLRQQIDIWPEPDQAYTIRIVGTRRLNPFTLNSHRATLPSRLVFLRALLFGGLHYRQADKQTMDQEYRAWLRRLKARQHGTRRYIPGAVESVAVIRPRLV